MKKPVHLETGVENYVACLKIAEHNKCYNHYKPATPEGRRHEREMVVKGRRLGLL
jgi:hypothetical protein